VFQVPVYAGWEDGPAALAATSQLLEDARKQAGQRLQALREQYAQSGVTIETRQVDGTPQQQIIEAGNDADLIVMGTHGRTGLQHFMLGSVAERVVRTAGKPVMTVPERALH
jgi:nucleotide-binding universal stress UspA family protein